MRKQVFLVLIKGAQFIIILYFFYKTLYILSLCPLFAVYFENKILNK